MKNMCLSFLIVVSFSLSVNAMQQGESNKEINQSNNEEFIQPPCMGKDIVTSGGQSNTYNNQQTPPVWYNFGGPTHFHPDLNK